MFSSFEPLHRAAKYVGFLIPFLVGQAFAFQVGGGPSSSASKVQVDSKLSVEKVPAGSTFKTAVILKVAQGWHINSNTPTYDYLIGTALELQQREGVILTDLQYPRGENLKFSFAEEPLNVYEGSVKIFLTVKVSERMAPGRDTLHAQLRVQACNDQVCLAPASIAVPIPVEIAGPNEQSKPINEDIFSSYLNEGGTPAPPTKTDIGQLI